MSDPRRERWTLITSSLVILATVAVGFVLWFTRSVMIPFVLAVFVVAVAAPLADWLEVKARFRRWMSVPLVLAIVLVFSAGMLLLLTYTASEAVRTLPAYANDVFNLASEWLKDVEVRPGVEVTSPNPNPEVDGPADADLDVAIENEIAPMADAAPGVVEEGLPFFDATWVRRLVKSFLIESRNNWEQFVLPTIGSLLGQLRSTVWTFALMMIFIFFLLVARDPSRLKLTGYATMEHKIRRYLAIKTGVSALTGVLVAAALELLGMPLVIVFGVLTFLLNFVPSIGSIIATCLPLPVAVAHFVLEPVRHGDPANWWMVLAVLTLPGSVQIIVGNVLEPRIMGEGLELHPIVILIGLVFWTLLWGPIGAILAVPIIAVIRIATARWVSLRPVSDLMAGKLPG
jgi:AI-2 transport protein TqsA